MATLTTTCPHCLTEHIALRVRLGVEVAGDVANAHLDCPKCKMPSCAVLFHLNNQEYTDPEDWQEEDVDLSDAWEIRGFWPQRPKPLIPEHLPPDVGRVYPQAERNFPIEGNEEATGTMYRKALDIGLKKIDPLAKGVLAVRIKKLAEAGKLTADIAEWANHVRDLGNDAAHEEKPPTRIELTDLRNITEMVMRYLFSLPALVTARRTDAAKS